MNDTVNNIVQQPVDSGDSGSTFTISPPFYLR